MAEYDKLIRDGIPNKLIQKGLKFDAISIKNEKPQVKWQYLFKKLDEEVAELKSAIINSRDAQSENVAFEFEDVYDVLMTIKKFGHINIYGTKKENNGDFTDWIVLKNVEG